MNTIETIINACKSPEPNPIKQFNGFVFEKNLGDGQQGVVLKITNKINKQFALKFYRPTDKDPSILNQSIKRFINEVNTLAALRHKNIVKIYTGGYAKWNNNIWDVTEGFASKLPEKLEDNEFFFYIMDYIAGYDLNFIFPELSKPDEERNAVIQPIGLRLKHFENLIKQVSKAMKYYHEKGITHKDIKPQNIRYSTEDSTFIIVDFGFARKLSYTQHKETIERVDYTDYPSVESGNYEKNDMGQFSKMLSCILPIFKEEYHENRYYGIETAINKGKDVDIAKRFKDMGEFYNQFKQYFLIESGWKFQLKLDEYITPDRFGRFDSKLRIPISGSILLFKEIRELIDTPEFQKLRGVRQLGSTMFVFPGANHTRFEHSIGVYYLSLKYLEKLLCLAEFRYHCEPIEKSIKLIILSALLHDIGHYPYSHWVEEITEFPNNIKLPRHEVRAEEILSLPQIESILINTWGVTAHEVSELISSKSKNELINSFINSVIDIDKIDYLVRDSLHCGVNYGKGIDVERLLDSLYFNPITKRLCVTEKGRSALLSIIATRNIMYQEVYWHKTVRGCEAMFKRFFYEFVLINSKSNKIKCLNQLNSLFNLSDDEFIAQLHNWSKTINNIKLQELILPFAFGGRKYLYKPAYIFFDNHSNENTPTNDFFRGLFKCKYHELVSKSKKLAKLLKVHFPDIEPLDIILEITPINEGEQYQLEGFEIYNTRKKWLDPHPKEIDAVNTYLKNNRQAYIYCKPVYYEKLKALALDENKTLQSILITLTDIT